MNYIDNWDAVQLKFREYWARENHDRPLILLTTGKMNAPAYPAGLVRPSPHERAWRDTEYVLRSARAWMERTAYFGEAFPCFNPNLGPDIFGASYGAGLVFERDTSYAVPYVEDWADIPPLALDSGAPWWREIRELTEAAVGDSRGDYFVGVTDIHAGADGLASIRGPENLCVDMIECPDEVSRRSFELFEGFKTYVAELSAITRRAGDGTSNWMGVWSPETWYVTSCDFSCMISRDMFDDYILPEIVAEAKFLGGNTIYHLDGPNALRHLPSLLAVPEIAGIQWVYGAGQPTAAHWLPVLKQIQDAGKLIHVAATVKDLPVLLENLRPEGVLYQITDALDEDSAASLMSGLTR